MYPKGNRNQILKIMNKQLQQKKHIIRQRREEEYDNKVKQWSSEKGDVDNMVKDSHWGYSSPRKELKFIGKEPKRISEGQRFWNELDQIIEELEKD